MQQYRKIRLFKCGKQGYTGMIESHDKTKVVFKVSKKIDFNTEHEYHVMQRLNDIAQFCPNFCKMLEMVEQNVEPAVKQNESPFTITSKYPLKKKVVVEEYVAGEKLYHHIKFGSVHINIIYSAIKQVMCAIACGQSIANFSHYDLHSDNILLTPCSDQTVYLYTFNNETAFAVPTYGYSSTIIDFGFAYIDSLEGQYMNTSMGHTDIGFNSHCFDWVADPKLFLISMRYELGKHRKSTKTFNNIVKNLFQGLTVDWECGWDDYGGRSAADSLIHDLEKKCPLKSRVFDKYIAFSFDLMCCLITLPISKKSYDNIYKSFSTFAKEFMKIEESIASTQYNLYILKLVVEAARKVKDDYVNGESERALSSFRKDVNSAILSVSRFCSPRQLHYEKMLLSLFDFASCAEGYFFNFLEKKMAKKNKEIHNLPVKGLLDIIHILNINLPDTFVYNEKTNLVVVDTNTMQKINLTLDNAEMIEKVNSAPHELKGIILYQYFKQKNTGKESSLFHPETAKQNESNVKDSKIEKENEIQKSENKSGNDSEIESEEEGENESEEESELESGEESENESGEEGENESGEKGENESGEESELESEEEGENESEEEGENESGEESENESGEDLQMTLQSLSPEELLHFLNHAMKSRPVLNPISEE